MTLDSAGFLFFRLTLVGLSGWLLATGSRRLLGRLAMRRFESSLRCGDESGAEQAFMGLLRWAPQGIGQSNLLNQACLDLAHVPSDMAPNRFGEFLLELLRKVDRPMGAEPMLTLLEAHLLRQQNATAQAVEIMDSQPTPRPDSALHRKNRGLFYEMAGDLERSVLEYRLALDMLARRRHPARSSLLRSMAQAYTRLGRLRDASVALADSLLEDPSSLEAVFTRIALAGLLERLGDCAAATACLEEGLTDCQRGADLLFQTLGELQCRQGLFEQAEAHLEQARTLNPEMLSVLLTQAELETRRGAPDRARAHLEQALELAPDSRPVLLGMARFYEGRGDDHGALSFLERAVDTAHEAPGMVGRLAWEAAVERLAQAYERLDRHDDALREYRRALRRFDSSPFLTLGLAECLGEHPEAGVLRQQAEALLRESLKRSPGDPRTLWALGRIALDQDDPAEAAGLLEAATRLSPRSCDVWLGLGKAYLRLDRADLARHALLQAREVAVRPDQRRLAERLAGD